MMNLIEKIHALLKGHGFTTLEAMVEAAYAHIDPLALPVPDKVPEPPTKPI